MSYVADEPTASTDVVFDCPPEPQASDTSAAGTSGHSDSEPLYVIPYETFNVDTDSNRSVTYGVAMDKSTDTMAAVYGSASLEEGGETGNVYAEASGRAELGAEDSESESESDSESEDEDETHKKFSRSGRPRQAKNWNEEFQKLLELPPSSEKFDKLARLAHDFVFAASTYGKIIISELGLPVEKKTIKPIAVGGQAGGEKYIVQGIFFKFALDIFGIYGGDEYAMKAASHDLKGLIHYYSCQIPGLHVPLMALIDYLGFRLIAITILPINANTIKYGSCDAGTTIHCEDPLLNAMMKKAARKMKLRGHFVGTPEGLGKKIYGPVDIEAHEGTDGRYYVVDFARTFPPERPAPQNVARKGIILYNLLRPELVKSNSVPLSSDAFTVWARADSKKDLYNLHVTQATERLFKEVIPEVAIKLNQLQESAEEGKTHLDLLEVLHSAGVNVRHLGHIRQLVSPKLQQTLLIEMIARIVRKQIAEKFRKKTREAGIPTEEPQKLAAVKHLNKLLGRHRTSQHYWRSLKRALLHKFSKCLLDAELVEGYDLRRSLDLVAFFNRLRVLSPNTIPLTDEAAKDFARAIKDSSSKTWGEWIPSFKFLLSDMTALHATVKHMNLIDIAEASAMFYSSLEEKGYDQSRLLVQGLGKFQVASRKMPFLDVDTIILLGDMLVAQARDFTAKGEGRDQIALLLSNALIAYQTALNIQPTNTKCILGVGNIYVSRGDYTAAISTYEEALRIDPTMALAYLQLAKAHKELGALSPQLAAVIEENLRKALEINPDYYDVLYMLGDLLLNSYYLVFKQRNLPDDAELDDESKRVLAEVGAIYSRTLAIKAYDEYPFIEAILAVATQEKPKTYNWSDLSLMLMWIVGESSPAFLQLLCNKLSTIPSLYMRNCRAFLTDPIFRGIVWASSSIHTLSITKNTTIQEETFLAWLEQHPVPLLELSIRQCPQFSDALLRKLASLPHAYSMVTLCVEGMALTKECLLKSFAPDPPPPAGVDLYMAALQPVAAPPANPHLAEEGEEKEVEGEKNEEERKEEEKKDEEEEEEEKAGVMSAEEKRMKEMKRRTKEDRWGHLSTLLISQIPDVNDQVIEVVSTLPSLTALEYRGCSAATSPQALSFLPNRLTKVSLGGAVTILPLLSLAKACSSLTHLSLKGVAGLSPQDQFKVTPHLPCLEHLQVPSGNVYLFSGTESVEVRYEEHGFAGPRFILGGKELYKFRPGPIMTMEGEDLVLTIASSPALKIISDRNHQILQASFGSNVGWSAAAKMEGITVPRLLQFMPHTRSFIISPGNQWASIQYLQQQGTANIRIHRGVNITTLLLLIYIVIYHKG